MRKLKAKMTQLINKTAMTWNISVVCLSLFLCFTAQFCLYLKNNQASQVEAIVTKQNLSSLIQCLAQAVESTDVLEKESGYFRAPSKEVGDEPQNLPNLVFELEVFFTRKNWKAGIHHLLATFLWLFSFFSKLINKKKFLAALGLCCNM